METSHSHGSPVLEISHDNLLLPAIEAATRFSVV